MLSLQGNSTRGNTSGDSAVQGRVSITPNQQQQTLFQKGSPVFAAPYRYRSLYSSIQCSVSSHKTTSKHLHYQLLLPLVPHHKAVKYLSHKHCHYSVQFHCPQLRNYSQVLSQEGKMNVGSSVSTDEIMLYASAGDQAHHILE